MKDSAVSTLVIVGGCLVVAPLAFLYLSYRLTSELVFEAVAHGSHLDEASLHLTIPGYYVPISLILGALCIFSGVLLSWQDRRDSPPAGPADFDLK